MQTKQLLDTLEMLGDHQHLRREKAGMQLKSMLKTASPGLASQSTAGEGEEIKVDESEQKTREISEMEQIALSFFKQMLKSRRWEDRYGSIAGTLILIENS